MLRSLFLSVAALTLAAQAPVPAPAAPEAPKAPAAPAASEAPKAPAAPKTPAAPKAPAAPKVDKILATIGTDVIRDSDFDLFLDLSLNEQQRMQLQFMPGGREQYLTRFLEFKALAAKARKEGFQKQPVFAKKLNVMEMQLLISSLMERDGAALQAKLALKDEEVKAYFDKHPEQFRTPEAFSARHILVATKAMGAGKALTEEEAKAKIAKIQAELAAGKTFEAAAKEYSDDPGSKDKGGLYENTPFGRFVPPFEAAVRAQAVGKVGDPVKSDYGYHLIQVEKIIPAEPQTFEAAKDQARKLATAQRQEQVMKAYMDAVKQEVNFKEGGSKDAAAEAAPAKAAKPVRKAAKAKAGVAK